MFFKSLAAAACLALTASAQSIQIGAPKEGATIHPGKNFTVEVDRPNSLTGSHEVAIVIAVQSCEKINCTEFAPTEVLGSILYSGPYNPQYQSGSAQALPPHQNFSFPLPQGMPHGNARLSVTHLSLVGAGPFALCETKNVSIVVG